VLPQTSAGTIFHEGIAMGKFQGVMIAQTPSGCRTDIANLSRSSEGIACKGLLALGNQLRGAEEDLRTARRRHQTPVLVRAACRVNGVLDVLAGRLLEDADEVLCIRRIAVFKKMART